MLAVKGLSVQRQAPPPPLPGCWLGEVTAPSEPQFPHLANGNNSNSFLRTFSGHSEAVKVKPS